MVNKPTLVTSFTEFERAFGSLEDVGTGNDTRNYLAYAARAFFDNGGRRLYVSRVFPFTRDNNEFIVPDTDFAKLDIGNPVAATWRARWPGLAGQTISVMVSFQRSKNILGTVSGTATLRGVQPGALVELVADRTQIPKDTTAPVAANLRQVDRLGNGLGYVDPATGQVVAIADDGQQGACHLTLTVTVQMGDIRVDAYPGLELDARGLPLDAQHPRSIFRVLQAQQPTDDLSLVLPARGDTGTGTAPAEARPATGRPAAVGGEPAHRAGRPGSHRPTLPVAARAVGSRRTAGTAWRARCRTSTTRRSRRPAWPRSPRSTTSRSWPCRTRCASGPKPSRRSPSTT